MTERSELLAAAAARMLGQDNALLLPLQGGGNARLFKVTTGAKHFVLKAYPAMNGDGRDRRFTEWQALQFMAAGGISNVPQPVATDKQSNASVLSWCEGAAVAADDPAIDQAARFINQLNQHRTVPAAASLPLASEACLSASELARQLNQRLQRLQQDAIADDDLQVFLSRHLAPATTTWPAAAKEAYAQRDWSFSEALKPAAQCLSPSDFGFHNALQNTAGQLSFVDFEYFGWDDPVKLAADFSLHPGMNLHPDQGRRFSTALSAFFGAKDGPDPGFAERLEILLPLYRLRWCCIVLNEFLPARWQRRQAAGNREHYRSVLRRQLQKAERLFNGA